MVPDKTTENLRFNMAWLSTHIVKKLLNIKALLEGEEGEMLARPKNQYLGNQFHHYHPEHNVLNRHTGT